VERIWQTAVLATIAERIARKVISDSWQVPAFVSEMSRILFLFVLCGLVTVSEASPEPELFAEKVISTGDDESHPAFTPDGKTLYFLKNDPSFNHWTIVVSHENNGKWSTPEVAPFSGQFSDADPFIALDGQRFFFISTRPVNGKAKEDTDIWMMQKSGGGAAAGVEAGAGNKAAGSWSEPQPLAVVNSEANEWFPTVSKNGNLYFGSERPGGKGKCDLYVSRLVDGKYQTPENLGEPINSSANEVEPYIAPDESYIIFAGTGLPESRGAYDIYVSFRRDGAWTKPVNLGDQINSVAWDFSPKVSPDGKWFFFTSNRGFAEKPLEKRLSYQELLQKLHSPGNGLRDIYKIDISALKLAK
jgi:Tol biopolymer transport system component